MDNEKTYRSQSKNLLKNQTFLAVAILVIGLIVILLTSYSFNLSNRDSHLSNSYANLSEQIRDLDVSAINIISMVNTVLSDQHEINVLTPLIESGRYIEKDLGAEERTAYEKFVALASLVGLGNSVGSARDIKVISDYWGLMQKYSSEVDQAEKNKVAKIQENIDSLKSQQAKIRENQNSIYETQVIVFWITIGLTAVNTILGFSLVLADRRERTRQAAL